MYDEIELALKLLAEPSVTPQAAGCFDLIESWLVPLGFQVQRRVFSEPGHPDTENFYARYGTSRPNLCFAGHVDVVPPGDPAAWRHPPFQPLIKDGIMYGRGAEDMKGAIAAMIAGVARYIKEHSSPAGSISFLLTADEEGTGINGTSKMLSWLKEQDETLDYCLVGEPTNPEALGEMAKIGRRGSVNVVIEVEGVQGHVAYPERAMNPITALVSILHRLKATPLDAGSAYFPPSNLEITSIDVGNPSENMIPAKAKACFNIRFSDHFSGESILNWIHTHAVYEGYNVRLKTRVSGESFLSPPGDLSAALTQAVQSVTGKTPELSTTGGTSDARFIHHYCPVIEFGTTGRTPHKVNEQVSVACLQQLVDVYSSFIENILMPA